MRAVASHIFIRFKIITLSPYMFQNAIFFYFDFFFKLIRFLKILYADILYTIFLNFKTFSIQSDFQKFNTTFFYINTTTNLNFNAVLQAQQH